MQLKAWLINLIKVLLGGAVFSVGLLVGGIIATLLRLPPATPPAGVDVSSALQLIVLTSPIIALALALLARGLGGGWLVRTLALSLMTWIAYTVNTQLEASIVSSFATSLPFTLVAQGVPSLLCGAVVACLFPADEHAKSAGELAREYFDGRSAGAWLWRLALAAVAFMPIYFAFGLMVLPFVAVYYQQSMFGLKAPTIEQLLPVLFARSVLFLIACLPILVLWQKDAMSLWLRLGIALYVLVGLLTLTATWLPLSVRLPHTLEIIADEFVYAGVLVLLLAKSLVTTRQTQRVMARGAVG